MAASILLLTGPPGAGKTTVATARGDGELTGEAPAARVLDAVASARYRLATP